MHELIFFGCGVLSALWWIGTFKKQPIVHMIFKTIIAIGFGYISLLIAIVNLIINHFNDES